ncbi:MAG TPA: acyl carrier protein [Allosphingosinicella sp.]|nr:acyl carrier protein [Allosphingosinicella sp.]
MTREDVRLRLQGIFRKIFDDESIELLDATTADDIEEWDSLNQIKIILAAEEEFGHSLNARRISTFDNVGDMIDYLIEVTGGGAA